MLSKMRNTSDSSKQLLTHQTTFCKITVHLWEISKLEQDMCFHVFGSKYASVADRFLREPTNLAKASWLNLQKKINVFGYNFQSTNCQREPHKGQKSWKIGVQLEPCYRQQTSHQISSLSLWCVRDAAKSNWGFLKIYNSFGSTHVVVQDQK